MDMTDELWALLEKLEKGVTIDMRYHKDKEIIRKYDQLVKYRYASCKETGPGDSILIYNITPSGKEALAAHQNP